MNRLKQLKTYPFGLFFILEEIFLGAAIFGEWPQTFIQTLVMQKDDVSSQLAFAPFVPLLSLIGLGFMGLRLPKTDKNNKFNKWLYLFLQLGLLWIPFLCNPNSYYGILYVTAYMVITIRACLIFELKESLVAGILIVMMGMLPLLVYRPDFQSFRSSLVKDQAIERAITSEQYQVIINAGIISGLLLFGLCVACISIMVKSLQKEYDSRQKLALAHNKLREYAMIAEDKAALDERNRIAREIHDSLGHTLTAQSIQLNNAIAFWQLEPTKAYGFLTESKTLVATALREIRYSVSAMRSDPLKDKDLATAINLLCQEFAQRNSIIPKCRISISCSLSNEIKITLYRVVQEALTNISKHSEATEVMVELLTLPGHLRLLIEDNGKGFDPEQNITGFGLQGMRERVAALTGYLQMSSDFGRGCTITVNIPRKQSLRS
jgi:signal transduction histidine kinase